MCAVLTVEQREDVMEFNHRLKQNRVLLTLLCDIATSETQQTFLDCLRKTYQKHLAAYIELDGGMKIIALRTEVDYRLSTYRSAEADYKIFD